MNKELKFRAWYKGDIEMGKPLKFVSQKIDDKLWFVMESDTSFKYPFETPFTDDDDWIVEQATGIKDKNANEIYEGDIVLTDEFNWKASVVYNNKYGQYGCEDNKGGFSFECNWSEFKILGNIHEVELN